jgi:antitoxin ParD1/3/4/toxin ParE1/3/4
LLADQPGSGHYRDELMPRDYRFWSVFSYLIVYRWQMQPIEIVAIVHGARDLGSHFHNN